MYKVNGESTKHYGTVIGIREYCKNNKWTSLKKPIGTSANKLTNEELTEFIESKKPDEINLIIQDKKGEIHHVDFPIESLTY